MPNDYPALMDPQTMGILAAAFQGLSASGPSRMPTSFGQIVGQAGQAGLSSYNVAAESQRRNLQTEALINLERQKSAMEQAKLAQATRQAAIQEPIMQALAQRFTGTGAPALPAVGGAPAPRGALAMPGVPGGPMPPAAPGGNSGVLGMGLNDLAAMKIAGLPDLLEYYKANEPNLEVKDGIVFDKRNNRVVGTLPFGNASGEMVQPRQGADGSWSIGPVAGSVETRGQFLDAAEAAKARRDLVRVPSTAPNQPPMEMTREQRVNAVGGGPERVTIQSQSPEATINIQGASRAQLEEAAKNDPETRKLLEGAGAIKPSGQAAGMSPQQEAQVVADSAQGKSISENYGKLYNDAQNASMHNPAKIAKLTKIGEMLNGFEGGRFSKSGYELARGANSLGLKLDPRLSNKEAAEAMASEIALENRSTASGGGMPGAMSDADREFLKGMAPNMAQTDAGRKSIIDARLKVMEREDRVAAMMRAYRQKHGRVDESFFSQLQSWSNRNPVFGKQ